MDSLEQRATTSHDIPRFDDGMVNIRELIRIMAESLANEIMDAQAEDACGEGSQRNGYRERDLVTSVGVIRLRIPKLRCGSFFPEDLLVRHSRVDRAVIAAVSEMVTNSVSTRKVERVAAQMGIDRMSSSQVSRICETLDDAVADLQGRDLFGTALPFLDFPYVHHRRLRTDNVQERANRELKRRSRVVQAFPSRRSLIRMMGAVFSEMDEDWATRRWFTEASMAQAASPVGSYAPAPSYDGTAEEHAKRIIDVVVADNPIGRRAAKMMG
ncbi:MAG: transposase [Eggerthellales bacterium]|nr:transposase [Eggerthellales bacterium]